MVPRGPLKSNATRGPMAFCRSRGGFVSTGCTRTLLSQLLPNDSDGVKLHPGGACKSPDGTEKSCAAALPADSAATTAIAHANGRFMAALTRLVRDDDRVAGAQVDRIARRLECVAIVERDDLRARIFLPQDAD